MYLEGMKVTFVWHNLLKYFQSELAIQDLKNLIVFKLLSLVGY